MAAAEPEPESGADRYDRWGNLVGSEHAEVYPHEEEEETAERVRAAKWRKMLGDWGAYGEQATGRRAAKLKRRCRKGIPIESRGRAWLLLSGAHAEMQAAPGRYQDLAITQVGHGLQLQSPWRT